LKFAAILAEGFESWNLLFGHADGLIFSCKAGDGKTNGDEEEEPGTKAAWIRPPLGVRPTSRCLSRLRLVYITRTL
jgi:hypothetical protein